MDAAMRVREALESHNAFRVHSSDALSSRLQLEVSRIARECDEATRCAAAHEAARQAADARADFLERALEAAEAAAARERLQAAAARADRDSARRELKRLEIERVRERNDALRVAAEPVERVEPVVPTRDREGAEAFAVGTATAAFAAARAASPFAARADEAASAADAAGAL